ncbi:MAG: hypothetical protein NXI24_24570 [bacterium]|nr:hypothetical protein [bacterium]
MKCPECGTITKNREVRAQCPKCAYGWVFGVGDSIRDTQFLALIRKASNNFTAYYTKNQLYAAHVARNAGAGPGWLFAISAVAIGIAALALAEGMPIEILLIIAPVILLFGYLTIRNRSMLQNDFEVLLRKWITRRGNPERLLRESELRLRNPPPDFSESDIYDYGVEKVLIVERDILVDFFVLNEFAMREKALVISETGYPVYLEDRLREIVIAQPNVPVYLLHDATDTGVKMRSRVIQRWPQIHVKQILDCGLFAAQIKSIPGLKRMRSRQPISGMPVDFLSVGRLGGLVAAALATNANLAQAAAADHRGHGGSYG